LGRNRRNPKIEQNYQSFLLNDVVQTTTFKVAGYPNRVQRNLFFHKHPVENIEDFQPIDFEEPKAPVRERRTVKSLDSFGDMDKILTVSDLLKQKLQNGEITQNCK